MTQHCPYDDKLLDYLYEEMSSDEADAFSEHWKGCAQCQSALEKLQGVRRAFRELPEPSIEEDTLQRMTAQILQQVQPQAAKKLAVQTLGSTKDLPSAEIAKILPFRRKGIKAVLFHPMAGVLAAAAMALVFVVVKGWQNEPIIPTLSENARSASQPGTASPAAAVLKTAAEAPSKGQAREEETLADERDKAGELGAKAERKAARATAVLDGLEEKAAKKLSRALDEDVQAGAVAGPSGGVAAKGDADDGNFGGLGKSRGRAGEAAKESPAVEMPQAKPRPEPTAPEREQRPQGSFAANDKAAASPAEPVAKGPASPPPIQAPAPSYAPQTQVQAPEIADGKDVVRQQLSNNQRNDLRDLTTRRPRTAATESQLANNEGSPPSLLEKLREHIKRGQCREAGEVQAQIGRQHPDFEIPQEDRAALARVCLVRQNQNQKFQDDLEVAEPTATKSRAPAAPPAPDYRRNKKAAPSKAKSSAY